MEDDEQFKNATVPILAIVEVTTQPVCKLNGPWTNADRQNIQYALKATDILQNDEEIASAAKSLYEECFCINDAWEIRMFAVARSSSQKLTEDYPRAIQMTIRQILAFIYARFQTPRWRKGDHQSWDRVGEILWNASGKAENETDFVKTI